MPGMLHTYNSRIYHTSLNPNFHSMYELDVEVMSFSALIRVMHNLSENSKELHTTHTDCLILKRIKIYLKQIKVIKNNCSVYVFQMRGIGKTKAPKL